MRIVLLATVLGTVSLFAGGQEPRYATVVHKGLWSSEAIYISYPSSGVPLRLSAPGGQAALRLEGYSVVVESGSEQHSVDDLVFDPRQTEVLWAPNASALTITWSEGGIVGNWRVEVLLITGEGVEHVRVSKPTRKDFMKRYQCDTGNPEIANEEPNLGAVKWLEGHRKLLLIAEVPPHSSCPQMSMIMGYVVSVPSGQIVERLEESKLRARWAEVLGSRLSD